jgi:translation initiation factor IF-3
MEDGTNLGVISFREALDKARDAKLDLIESRPSGCKNHGLW